MTTPAGKELREALAVLTLALSYESPTPADLKAMRAAAAKCTAAIKGMTR